ncbi:MAG: DUF4097 family beta strand repeat-containing protein [Christensenellales bacterium]
MNRSDFLEELGKALRDVPEKDRQDAILFFDELIRDKVAERGCSEEEAVTQLGSIGEIAETVRQTGPKAAGPAGTAPAGGEGYGVKTVTARADSVRSVEIDTALATIEVRPGKSDELILTYLQDERDIYDFSLEGGKLRLIRRPLEPTRLLSFIFQYRRAATVTLTVPAEFAASCSLRTANAGISMEGISLWGWLKAKTSNSSIHLAGVKAEGPLTAETSNGSIRLEAVQAKGELNARTSNAGVGAKGVKAQGITLSSSNSRLTADELESPAHLHLHSSNGDLRFGSLSSPDIRLVTSNARIEGSIRGRAADYSVSSHTSNGRNNLADSQGSGAKRLEVKTSNGSILVRFEDA